MLLRRLQDAAPACRLAAQRSAAAMEPSASGREMSTDITHFAIKNKGIKAGPGGRSSISGITATVFGCSGFLGRYVANALARQGSQVVVPYRSDEIDVQYLRQMGDLGQARGGHIASFEDFDLNHEPIQVVSWKDFNLRSDEHIRETIKRSNVVVNLIGAERETWNYSFEDVHIDAAKRIAQAAAENPLTERFVHVSCLGAKEDAASRRLRTKAEGDRAVREIMPGATIFKPGHLIGNEDRLYNTYAQLAKVLPFMPLIGDGAMKLQPTYVRDVSDAILHSLKLKHAVGKDYYLAGPEVLTLKQIVKLVYDTIREPHVTLPVPLPIARLLAMPRERLFRTIPIPVNTIFTLDAIEETTQDHLLPTGPDILTYADLEIVPSKVTEGFPIEHLRHYRVGGYDAGTTSESVTSGGAGYAN